MRKVDNDLKQSADVLNETKNNYNQVSRKQGTSYATMDLGDIIYNSQHVDPSTCFIEKDGSEELSTLIAIVHK
jgi:hypothetical protein